MAQIDADDLAELQEAILLLEEWRREPEDPNWPQRREWKLEPHNCEIAWSARGVRHQLSRHPYQNHGLGKTIMSAIECFKNHKHAE